MGTFSKNSLELLRSRIDLVEVLNPYLKLQRTGASYKGLCPFHEERTPSFVIQRGDSHYHCFGCGAHGDAIQFLMTHLKMSFLEAVEHLADRFQVELEEVAIHEQAKGPAKAVLKDALERASQFYQFYLLHTLEGHAALDYLYSRGITLDFIQQFHIGFAPKLPHIFLKVMGEHKISNVVLEEAGLVKNGREFFSDRITIPIRDVVGSVIGFSARKYRTDTFGGKYINTSETSLFKKSKVLFGLSFSRKNIAKTKSVLIVEGQFDALRLIYAGFDWTVAGQGTAFTEEMAKELIHLGVRVVYLAFDGDPAGKEAAIKTGHFFQKEGVEVKVLALPEKCDPDLMLQEKGPEEWRSLVDASVDYLTFLVQETSKELNMKSPAGKTELVQTIAKRIREWDHPLMVHESLRRLAQLTHTPESVLGSGGYEIPQVHIQRSGSVTFHQVDPDRILEADLLRWLFLMGESCPEMVAIGKTNLQPEDFRLASARNLFAKYLKLAEEGSPRDLLKMAIDLEQTEQQLFLAEVLQKRVNPEKALPCFTETIQKILERNWMQKREEIKMRIFSGTCSEEEVLELAREFDKIKKERPRVSLQETPCVRKVSF
ncbi:MAG: DNA primase [Chlamydiae bacterium RIFCSPHIGHO2_12_FULL_44_59]|nr:MAG: DNA primase [Chlamydiae bacterium RIFCSPHIGHO2_01_FULL_44_39]OGN58502.1 MAG: DNA primase [Chlamydiae bacterium RIFCSPHIGHO2_02_FULL_45_9]OGN59719.1 MAG: DNA primase [Chlamydiae bacterium RIFCSPHIGHO2_12_FULL_44_59]OGN65802.1 MAG: DNA primase [Chlamydiae bacterium RIFCSPLOWO2_01_FULL_44_52]OGN67979.1 MAG: DNA primase [Chlamydiae bacterium RIFCSPLOWO2_02_FULL_45_22]OGN69534.1 MAG: DNA primase [Chlamydiae bacterium RIFCSPLOWO2_12_FULL_45_20]